MLKQCIMDVLNGEKDRFRYIVREYEKRIFYYFLRMTRNYDESRDLTQNTFLRVFKYLGSYDFGYSFTSWIYAIAHNQLRDMWAKNKGRKEGSLEELEEKYFLKFASDEKVLDRLEEKNLKKKVKESIYALPELYREIMILLIIEGNAYEDISRIMDLPLNTVKIRIHRARKLLRKSLEKWL